MRDTGRILIGLAVFVALVSSPLWVSAVRGTTAAAPELELGTDAEACIAPTEYMRTSHMDLLDEWRDDVVRRGVRTFVAPDGVHHEMSLTDTCIRCHSKPEQFCDRCHDYMAVDPYCWDCHIQDREGE